MLEFPMVWQWWLALGKTAVAIYCVQLYALSFFLMLYFSLHLFHR